MCLHGSAELTDRPDEIQKWIDRGWLKSRSVAAAGTKASIIDPDDFCQFVRQHGHAVVNRRLTHSPILQGCPPAQPWHALLNGDAAVG